MGIIPLEFMRGQNFTTLELTGKEEYTIEIPQNLTPRCLIKVEVRRLQDFLKLLNYYLGIFFRFSDDSSKFFFKSS